jgi:hypothetical protein
MACRAEHSIEGRRKAADRQRSVRVQRRLLRQPQGLQHKLGSESGYCSPCWREHWAEGRERADVGQGKAAAARDRGHLPHLPSQRCFVSANASETAIIEMPASRLLQSLVAWPAPASPAWKMRRPKPSGTAAMTACDRYGRRPSGWSMRRRELITLLGGATAAWRFWRALSRSIEPRKRIRTKASCSLFFSGRAMDGSSAAGRLPPISTP